jgi:hypothetical protein
MIRNLLLFALCCSAFTASASTIIVNSLNDDADCSLRNAILAANTDTAVAGCALRGVVHENFDQIQIAVSGTYSPTSPLPAVTDAVQMDATLGTFVLDGTAAGATTNGLQLEAYAMVRGFVIQNFGGSGIVAHGGLTVSGCRIGTDAAGLKAAPNCTGVGSAGAGILLESVGVAPRTSLVLSGWIGGSSVAERNVISGNQCDGVVFRSTPGYLMYGEIAGNYIGADSCGCDVIPNSGYGVVLEGGGDHQAYDVTVGEMGGLGKACDGCNVIAGNPLGQIHISGGIGCRRGSDRRRRPRRRHGRSAHERRRHRRFQRRRHPRRTLRPAVAAVQPYRCDRSGHDHSERNRHPPARFRARRR